MIDAINATGEKYDFAVWAFVLMPEHVHVLLYPRQSEYSLSRILSGGVALSQTSISRVGHGIGWHGPRLRGHVPHRALGAPRSPTTAAQLL